MRGLAWVAVVVMACSSSERTKPERIEDPDSVDRLTRIVEATAGSAPAWREPTAPATTERTDPYKLIHKDAISVATSARAADFPVFKYYDGFARDRCYEVLRDRVRTVFQIELAAERAYFVFEGDLPRRAVEECVVLTHGGPREVTVRSDGELAVFDIAGLGTVYAAWRGSTIVAGTKEQVLAVLDVANMSFDHVRARLAEHPGAQTTLWRRDRMSELLVGVPADSYVLSITNTRPKYVAFRVTLRYASRELAESAAGRFEDGRIDFKTRPENVAGFKRMKVVRSGARVDVTFDTDMFEGVGLPELQQLVADLGDAAARPR